MIDAFVTKILIAILKKAAVLSGLRFLTDGFTVLSWFEAFQSIHQCADLPKCVVEVSYDVLVDTAIDELVDRVIDNRFDVSQTKSGLYVASTRQILQPTIVYPSLGEWQRSGFSESFAHQYNQTRSDFASSLERRRSAFREEWVRRRFK